MFLPFVSAIHGYLNDCAASQIRFAHQTTADYRLMNQYGSQIAAVACFLLTGVFLHVRPLFR